MKGHLRKTARGASSPAKPALHIPDLRPSLAVLTCDPHRVGSSDSMKLRSFGVSLRGGANDKSYPLSITKAATSSVDREDDQHSRLRQAS